MRPLALASLSNSLSIHMWIIENGAQMRPCDQFYDRLVLEPEMGSNLISASTLVTQTGFVLGLLID